MWTMEDIIDLNPADTQQRESFLGRLLELAATTESQLLKFASLLASRSEPYVATCPTAI